MDICLGMFGIYGLSEFKMGAGYSSDTNNTYDRNWIPNIRKS